MAEMFSLMATLNGRTTEVDTAALLAFADAQPQANASRIGAVGYCMSGPFVMWAAAPVSRALQQHCVHPRRQHLATDQPDSPHLMAPKSCARATLPAPGSTNGRHRLTSKSWSQR